MSKLPPAIFLMGPTASGKTGVAVELAQHLPVEIISVDSALVFRDMNIGTAKPDAATLARAPHHLIDIIAPTEAYSAAAFRRDALRLMADITARGKVPLLVGGTMLYFKALREGLSPLPQADAEVRAKLDALIARHGIEYLHAELARVDAATAARLHPTDTQRIQRAMEVYLVSGKPMSELVKSPPSLLPPLPACGHPLPQAGEGRPRDSTVESPSPLPACGHPLSRAGEGQAGGGAVESPSPLPACGHPLPQAGEGQAGGGAAKSPSPLPAYGHPLSRAGEGQPRDGTAKSPSPLPACGHPLSRAGEGQPRDGAAESHSPLPACGHPLPRAGEGQAGGGAAKSPSPLPLAGEGLGERVTDDLPYDILPLALLPSDRAVLHQRIALRFGQMLKDGLVEELRGLREKYPLQRDMTAMRCVGYRQAWEYLAGEITQVELLEKGIAATRQLAKRQLTWLRSMEVMPLDCLADDLHRQVSRRIETFLA